MNGLDAILNRIMTDAEDRIRDIREQADARCAELRSASEQEAMRIVSEAKRKAEEQASVLKRRAESLAALEARKSNLATRQILIDEVIDQAASRLANLPADEKSALYKRFLLDQASGRETVVFAKQDEAVADSLLSRINQEKGWQLQRDTVPGDFSVGLILRQDLIETNLSVDLLIRSLRPELVKLAAEALFSE